jgi:hypothetical protein
MKQMIRKIDDPVWSDGCRGAVAASRRRALDRLVHGQIPNPKFASFRGDLVSELLIRKDTRNLKF